MTEEKGLDPSITDNIGEYVNRRGLRDLLSSLRENPNLKSNASVQKGLEDMDLLFTYLETFDVLDRISFDLSLARGLDYYTGVIFEVVTEGSAPPSNLTSSDRPSKKPRASTKATENDEDRSSDPSVGVGSVAAGGRYDELVGMFSGRTQIPCVGISFGVDRIFSITKARMESASNGSTSTGIRNTEVDVYVMAFGGKGFDGFLKERMDVAKALWDAGIKVRYSPGSPLKILLT